MICTAVKNNSEIASVVILFVIIMLATEYLDSTSPMEAYSLLSTCVPTFRSHLEITALPHTNTNFSILRGPCFLSLA